VRIDVPQRTEDEKDDSIIRIRVEGTAEFVKKAAAEIGSLRDEVKGEKIQVLTIEQRHHKSLIGPNGRTLQKTIVDAGGPEDKSIQARIVRFPRPGEESDRIVLTGPPVVVDKIAERFLEFATRETIDVDVPTERLSRIIGAGGRKRMELEAEFDVVIYVPQMARGNHGSLEKVKITGQPDQNQKAKKAILVPSFALMFVDVAGHCEEWRCCYCSGTEMASPSSIERRTNKEPAPPEMASIRLP